MKCHAIHAYGLEWDQRRFMIQSRFYFADLELSYGVHIDFWSISLTKVHIIIVHIISYDSLGYGPKIGQTVSMGFSYTMNHGIKPTKVEYTSGGNFTKAASLPEKMCCGNAIVIGKGSEQTIYLSGGLR